MDEKKEYIERDKLIKWLRSCKNACIEVCKGLNNNIEKHAAEEAIAAYDDCIGYAESVPAADVAPVVHGEWLHNPKREYDYICSVCRGDAPEDRMRNNAILTPYCPHCGAKMDGGKHGQT
jgi:hypothetical protein